MTITYITLENLKEILASHLDNAIAETIMAECQERAGSQIRKSERTKQYNRLYHEVSALLCGRIRDVRDEFDRQRKDLTVAFYRAAKLKRFDFSRKKTELSAQRSAALLALDRENPDFPRLYHETRGVYLARLSELMKTASEEQTKLKEDFEDDLEGITLYYERLIQNLDAIRVRLKGAELEYLQYIAWKLQLPRDEFRTWTHKYAKILDDIHSLDLEPEDIESDADETPSDSDAEA